MSGLVVVIVVVFWILYSVSTIPMDQRLKTALYALPVILLILWLWEIFGVLTVPLNYAAPVRTT